MDLYNLSARTGAIDVPITLDISNQDDRIVERRFRFLGRRRHLTFLRARAPNALRKISDAPFEITAPKLFLCTNTAQKVEGVVSLDEPICWLGAEIENAIEAQRPEGSLSRSRSLILALAPGGAEFTYLVEPLGRLERQNVGWLQRLQDSDPFQPGVIAHYANGYWSGEECPEARGEPWEYRAAKARLLKRIGRSARER